jgi:hypothetical protein
LQEISIDNAIRVSTSKNLTIKSTMFPHHSIQKYNWVFPEGKTNNQTDHVLIDRQRHSSVLDVLAFREIDSDTDHYLVVETLGRVQQ